MTIPDAIARAVAGESLDEAEMATVMGRMMDGEATPAQIASLLTALRMKGETADELVGAARAMRARMTPLRVTTPVVDTCGTGGDGLSTFNVSTAAALIAAGAGVAVAKHGNRAISGRVGGADVLEALGVTIDLSAAGVARCVAEACVADHAVGADAHPVAERHRSFEHHVDVDEHVHAGLQRAAHVEPRGVGKRDTREHEVLRDLRTAQRLHLGELDFVVDAQDLGDGGRDERVHLPLWRLDRTGRACPRPWAAHRWRSRRHPSEVYGRSATERSR